jgi:deazaflavin-dependent oxidoreductase (nitroreductase family)
MSMLTKTFVKTNAWLYRLSGGRLGSRLGAQSVLLLHTVGRKSGKEVTTPLSYYRDGDRYLVVASNWGKEEDPDWYRNLLQNPRLTIQVRQLTLQVEARPAPAEEYPRLWKLVTSKNPQYLEYQKAVTRQIPIVILTPIAEGR